MKELLLLIIFILILGTYPKAEAFLIAPEIMRCASSTDGGYWFGQEGQGCGTAFFQGDEVAYQFYLETPVYVSSIEAWIAYNDVDLNTKAGAKVAIYDATAGTERTGPIPMLSAKVFEKAFTFDVDPHASQPAEWRGPKDFSIDLQPGVYWMSFEDGTRGTFVSGKEGFRMEAVHNPEPATMFLMGGGLLAMLRRKKISAA